MIHPQLFVRLSEAEQAFSDLLDPHKDTWLLNLYGLSGHGKTPFLRWLIDDKCKSNQIKYSAFDLKDRSMSSPNTLFYEIIGSSDILPSSAQKEFEKKKKAVQSRKNELIAKLMGVRANAKQTVTQIAILSKLLKQKSSPNFDDFASALRKIEDQATAEINDTFIEVIRHIDALDTHVVFLDHFEHFRNKDIENEMQIIYLLQRANSANRNLVFVVAGREKLASEHPEIVFSKLEPLTESECAELLTKQGILDKKIHKKLFASTKGHPFATRLLTSVLQLGEEKHIPSLTSIDKFVTWAITIIDHLPKKLQDASFICSLLRGFNKDIVDHLSDDPLSFDEFGQLVRLDFIVKSTTGYGWSVHDLVRRSLMSYWARSSPSSSTDKF